jgi:hypothetical protein
MRAGELPVARGLRRAVGVGPVNLPGWQLKNKNSSQNGKKVYHEEHEAREVKIDILILSFSSFRDLRAFVVKRLLAPACLSSFQWLSACRALQYRKREFQPFVPSFFP